MKAESYAKIVRNTNVTIFVTNLISLMFIWVVQTAWDTISWPLQGWGWILWALVVISFFGMVIIQMIAGPEIAKQMKMLPAKRLAQETYHPLDIHARRLVLTFETVMAQAKMETDRYKLFIKPEKKDKNAFFAGMEANRVVAVYQTVLESTTRDELAAVLAHEVGHAANSHTGTLALSKSISGVFGTLAVIIFGLGIVPLAIAIELFKAADTLTDNLLTLVGCLLGLALAAVAAVTALVVYLPSLLLVPITAAQNRAIEYLADAYATKLGYGRGLVSFFQKLEAEEAAKNMSRATWFVLEPFVDHPATYKRIAKVQEYLDGDEGMIRDRHESLAWVIVKTIAIVGVGIALSFHVWEGVPALLNVPLAYWALGFWVFNLDALFSNNGSTYTLAEKKTLDQWVVGISLFYLLVFFASGLVGATLMTPLVHTPALATALFWLWMAKPVVALIGFSTKSETFSTLSDFISHISLILFGVMVVQLFL